MNKLYHAREFAVLAGVSVRALHHYDRLQLLQPQRTDAGYRLYSLRELERLQQIIALKFLGLSLSQIKDLLDRETRNLPDVLQSQRQALEEKRRHVESAIRAIEEAQRTIYPGRQPDAAILKKLIEVMTMQDNKDFMTKYYSEGAQAKMADRRETWTPELQQQMTADWMNLFHDVEAALGEDPAGEKAQALAARWTTLVNRFTGGDPEMNVGLRNAWADREHWPATPQGQTAAFSNRDVWQFIGRAMTHRKA